MNAAEKNEPSLLEAALGYARDGFPVFPCDPNTKRPLIKSGFKSASTNEAQVRSWWERWPDAMLGMPSGSASGAWVLDVDDPELFEQNCDIDLPETRRCETGKGYHLYFRFDRANPVANKQQHPKTGWPFPSLPGAETRGEGGYVILPPSVHPSGRRYRWSIEGEPAEPPAALLQVVRASRTRHGPQDSAGAHQPDHPYCLAALESECTSIKSAGSGEQEGTLNGAALKMGHDVGAGVLSFQTARTQLTAAGLAMPSFNSRDPWTPEKIIAKVDNGLRDGMAEPKGVPEQRDHSFSRGGARAQRDDPGTGEFHGGERRSEPPIEAVLGPVGIHRELMTAAAR